MGKPRFDETWLDETAVKTLKTFKYAGQVGTIDMYSFVTWGGMGFQLDAACPGLKLAAMNAK